MGAFRALVHFLLRLFGKIENHTKPPLLDGGTPEKRMKDEERKGNYENLELIPNWFPASKNADPDKPKVTQPEFSVLDLNYVCDPLPKNREQVYEIYGRPPKEKGHYEYPKANLRVHSGLLGDWNNGTGKLYMQERAGEHLKEALVRMQALESRLGTSIISYIKRMGSYSFRKIRHDENAEYSYHSWAIAVDIDPPKNRGVTYFQDWQKRENGKWVTCAPSEAKRGPIHRHLPFSKGFIETWPSVVPLGLVLSMKSTFFSWGGDWGRSSWHAVVRKYGVGFDQNDPAIKGDPLFKRALAEWKTIRYVDPMHFELVLRGSWAQVNFSKKSKV